MSTILDAPGAGTSRAGAGTSEPPVWMLVLIFWAAFAAAAIVLQTGNPDMFRRTDPDSAMRLVQVRDLLAGQGWFDLVQHRMDPPQGSLMHWSRMVDAPLAGLLWLGGVLGLGESLALTAWPLLLLLGFMAAAISAATALGGRGAALPATLMLLAFVHPLVTFLPGSIDHHNAQIALLLATLAAALWLRLRDLMGLAAGAGCAAMLAIGLETLPYVMVIGAAIGIQWAWSGEGGRGAALFGLASGFLPAALYLTTGSPAAPVACDALSWAYAGPAAMAGLGLATLPGLGGRLPMRTARFAGLGVVALLAGAALLLIAPQCAGGPYGALSPDLRTGFLAGVAEAQPLLSLLTLDPAEVIAKAPAPLLACVIAGLQAWRAPEGARAQWLLPGALIAAALLLGLFQQQRTMSSANAVAIPVLAAWIAGLTERRGVTSLRPLRRSAPVLAAFLLSLPAVHLAVGWVLLPAADPTPAREPAASAATLTNAERDCVDPASAARLRELQPGLVLAPLFFGPDVLAMSHHSVVAGPYHRSERAILDTLEIISGPPDSAAATLRARAVDYVAICVSSAEAIADRREAPGGLLARLLAGDRIAGLEPVPGNDEARLKLFRVVR